MSFLKDFGKKLNDFLIESTPIGSFVDITSCPNCKNTGSVGNGSFKWLGNNQVECNSCKKILQVFAKCPECGRVVRTIITGLKVSCKKCGHTASTHDFEIVLK